MKSPSNNNPSKTALVKALLQSGEAMTTRDIAILAGSTPQYVNRVREQFASIQNGASVRQNIQRLNQDVKDLRALVLHHSQIINQLTGKKSKPRASQGATTQVISIAS